MKDQKENLILSLEHLNRAFKTAYIDLVNLNDKYNTLPIAS